VPLTIETRHDDHTMILSCHTCVVTVPMHTLHPSFLSGVEAFFEAHGNCTSTVDLRDS
jgi:hypothetical protein